VCVCVCVFNYTRWETLAWAAIWRPLKAQCNVTEGRNRRNSSLFFLFPVFNPLSSVSWTYYSLSLVAGISNLCLQGIWRQGIGRTGDLKIGNRENRELKTGIWYARHWRQIVHWRRYTRHRYMGVKYARHRFMGVRYARFWRQGLAPFFVCKQAAALRVVSVLLSSTRAEAGMQYAQHCLKGGNSEWYEVNSYKL